MRQLNLKTTHKAVKDYYAALAALEAQGAAHEGAVKAPFGALLQSCAKKMDAALVEQYEMRGPSGNRIVIDGAALHESGIPFAYWEAKDCDDDLDRAVQEKRALGYPFHNILFQTPERGLLFQNDAETLDADLTRPAALVEAVKQLFAYEPPELGNWEAAASEFRTHVPTIAEALKTKIEEQRASDREFENAFGKFHDLCRASINPDLSVEAIEEMLIQHILTERIFRAVFHNSAFTRRNVIAREIEQVVDILTRKAFSREEFLRPLDPYHGAIERAAQFCKEYSQKQHLLNAFYETFFQSFSEDVADTHGIVYTPQPIVDFMVNSVEHLLQTEFKRSLSSEGVHVIDPFVGTGNFIARVMQEIAGASLEKKYAEELHCNEVMLLPYYIANLNIEQEYYQRIGSYKPFEGIALADTFELLEPIQRKLFTPENTERVRKQKEADMFVVIGNPPYNAGQVNENDNNKNRKYKLMDRRIAETYAVDSKAKLKRKLYDPYVKAIRWASDRIGDEGVVAFVTNNSFLDAVSFDGMRKHLADDFDAIYILDLGGNMRKGLKVSDSNVFGIRIGVSISLFVKNKVADSVEGGRSNIYYFRTDDNWNKDEKFAFMYEREHVGGIDWQQIQPDDQHNWMMEGLRPEFEGFIPIASEEMKKTQEPAENVIFKTYSLGISTNRDWWAYNSNKNDLVKTISSMIDTYNNQVIRWEVRTDDNINLDDFLISDDTIIKWSRNLKRELLRKNIAEYADDKIRISLYRPFTKRYLFFDKIMNDETSLINYIYPTQKTEKENRTICLSGGRTEFWCILTNKIPNLTLTVSDGNQCFPYYVYDEDGSNRRENITDWALDAFRSHYQDDSISKQDIFHYVYGLLHHPVYRERYAANLKRDLPHIPYAADFWGFARAGSRLGALHVNYETGARYPLEWQETEGAAVDFRVEKMRLSKDKRSIAYNGFLTLAGVPEAALEYRLGNRSALEWVIDQYRVKTDKRSGIVNDPNRPDEPRYIAELLERVIALSLETQEIVSALPSL